MKWARLILAVVLVLGTASVAGAGCGWLLWDLVTDRKSMKVWKLNDGFADRASCADQRAAILERVKETSLRMVEPTDLTDIKLTEDSFSVYIGDKEIVKTSLKCLPDTIDPREKK